MHEAERLASQGAVELNLIAQDTTRYGKDLPGSPDLSLLLRELATVDGIRWLRVFYSFPSNGLRPFVATMATTPKVCPYVDIPLQHADDAVLRAMNRPGSGADYLQMVHNLRAVTPDVCIRTTFIVGFPGETEEAFSGLLDFTEQAQLDRVGVFEYSAEEGTPAAAMSGQVPARVKRERRDRLMRLQQQVSLARNRRWVGRTLEVLVERREGARAVGRSFRDGPEVDGLVMVDRTSAQPGTFVTALIRDALEYDLSGVEARRIGSDSSRTPDTEAEE